LDITANEALSIEVENDVENMEDMQVIGGNKYENDENDDNLEYNGENHKNNSIKSFE